MKNYPSQNAKSTISIKFVELFKYLKSKISNFEISANVNTQPNYVGRIGNESNRTRPIKVVFKDSHVKYRFMKRLKELKQHDKYSNMSITDDVTRMERDLVKEWKKKANARNQRERNKDYVWRVRGSSREGLYLKKIHCRSV